MDHTTLVSGALQLVELLLSKTSEEYQPTGGSLPQGRAAHRLDAYLL